MAMTNKQIREAKSAVWNRVKEIVKLDTPELAKEYDRVFPGLRADATETMFHHEMASTLINDAIERAFPVQ
jgi:hypothetical protein